MNAVLQLRRVVKDFPGHRAVDDISLALAPGGFYSLLGPSGCGKTTTLRMIGGFEQPTAGEILLNGAIVNNLKPYQRDVSTVFQNYALFPHLSALRNVEFGLRERGVPDRERRALQALDLVQLTGKRDRMPSELSGGEKQRVALARALLAKPDWIFLDEATASLDPEAEEDLYRVLRARLPHVTLVSIAHRMSVAALHEDEVKIQRTVNGPSVLVTVTR